MNFNPDSLIRSVVRFSKMAKLLQQEQQYDLLPLIQKESTIMVRRAIGLWFAVRGWRLPQWSYLINFAKRK